MALRTNKTWFGVVLDAPDARDLAHFYQRLLGWTIFNESDDWVDLAPSEDAGYNLAFATEKHYARPVWPTVEGRGAGRSVVPVASVRVRDVHVVW
jgi:hypothetical protein